MERHFFLQEIGFKAPEIFEDNIFNLTAVVEMVFDSLKTILGKGENSVEKQEIYMYISQFFFHNHDFFKLNDIHSDCVSCRCFNVK